MHTQSSSSKNKIEAREGKINEIGGRAAQKERERERGISLEHSIGPTGHRRRRGVLSSREPRKVRRRLSFTRRSFHSRDGTFEVHVVIETAQQLDVYVGHFLSDGALCVADEFPLGHLVLDMW